MRLKEIFLPLNPTPHHFQSDILHFYFYAALPFDHRIRQKAEKVVCAVLLKIAKNTGGINI